MNTTHLGIETWGKNRRSLRGKKSKLDLVHEIQTKLHSTKVDLLALDIKDLTSILDQEIGYKPEMPAPSRTKAPYIEQLKKTFPKVKHFEKLSVEGLALLIKALQ